VLRQLSPHLRDPASEDFFEFFRQLAGYDDPTVPPQRLHLAQDIIHTPRRFVKNQRAPLSLQPFKAFPPLSGFFREKAFEDKAICR
jgi:hypothetical protein